MRPLLLGLTVVAILTGAQLSEALAERLGSSDDPRYSIWFEPTTIPREADSKVTVWAHIGKPILQSYVVSIYFGEGTTLLDCSALGTCGAGDPGTGLLFQNGLARDLTGDVAIAELTVRTTAPDGAMVMHFWDDCPMGAGDTEGHAFVPVLVTNGVVYAGHPAATPSATPFVSACGASTEPDITAKATPIKPRQPTPTPVPLPLTGGPASNGVSPVGYLAAGAALMIVGEEVLRRAKKPPR